MTNMPNAQQISAVSQGAQASIADANRSANTREQLRGQQAMQQQAIQARAAEADKQRLFDQKQFDVSHGLQQQKFAEEKRKQGIEEARARSIAELQAKKTEIDERIRNTDLANQEQLVQQKNAIQQQLSNARKEAGIFSILANKNKEEIAQFIERIPDMRNQIEEQRQRSIGIGDDAAAFAMNRLGEVFNSRFRGMEKLNQSTILGFDVSNAAIFDEFNRQMSAEELSTRAAEMGLGGIAIDPTKPIMEQITSNDSINSIARSLGMGPLAKSIGESIAAGSQGQIDQEQATVMMEQLMAVIVSGDAGDLTKEIEKASLDYGINGNIVSSAIRSMSRMLGEKASSLYLTAQNESPTQAEPEFFGMPNLLGAGRFEIPTGYGLLGVMGTAMGRLSDRLDLASRAVEDRNFQLQDSLDTLDQLQSFDYNEAAAGGSGFGSGGLSVAQIRGMLSEDLGGGELPLLDQFVRDLQDIEDIQGQAFSELGTRPASAKGYTELGDLLNEAVLRTGGVVTDQEQALQNLMEEIQFRQAQGRSPYTPQELAELLELQRQIGG